MQLLKNDTEGRLIQTSGVDTVVYRQDLWWAKTAQRALMRLGNLDVPYCLINVAIEQLMAKHREQSEQLEQALGLLCSYVSGR